VVTKETLSWSSTISEELPMTTMAWWISALSVRVPNTFFERLPLLLAMGLALEAQTEWCSENSAFPGSALRLRSELTCQGHERGVILQAGYKTFGNT
jgi:hypothetical protein